MRIGNGTSGARPYEPFDLDPLAEVQQQTHGQARSGKIIETLCGVGFVVGASSLDLDQHAMVHHKIGDVVAHNSALIAHLESALRVGNDARSAKLVRQSVLVDLLQEAAPERVVNAKSSTDDQLGDLVQVSLC